VISVLNMLRKRKVERDSWVVCGTTLVKYLESKPIIF
jgi:hypothetical protein